MQLPDQGEYIGQIRSWHFAMRNLSIIDRFEHLGPEESVDSITYSQNRAFGVFVRVHRSENTTPHKAQPEQRALIDPALPEIEGICRNVNRNYTNHGPDGYAICSLSMK